VTYFWLGMIFVGVAMTTYGFLVRQRLLREERYLNDE
jgi:protein-S-isoprenylcysteine O-methyltransferase Ste14